MTDQRERDAVLLLVAAYDGSLADDTVEFDHLFDHGLLRLERDYSDEYHSVLTDAGIAFVREVVHGHAANDDSQLSPKEDR